jgi:hypothetical protein
MSLLSRFWLFGSTAAADAALKIAKGIADAG